VADLLFIFGCLDLDVSPHSKMWGRNAIEPSIASLGSSDLVLTGGDIGPPRWASESAMMLGKRVVELRDDGYRYINNNRKDPWRVPSATMRDDKLIEACVKSRSAGWSVKIVALVSNPMAVSTKYLLYKAQASEFQIQQIPYVPPTTYVSTLPPILWTDTETTGVDAKRDRMIEIAAIHTDPSSRVVLSTFHRRIALLPGVRVPDYIAAINHYSDALWVGAPPAREVMRDFVAWAPPAFVLAGYNISFDKRHILAEFARHNIVSPKITGTIDTLSIARKILKKRGLIGTAKLSEVCEYFGISNADAHGAMPDAEMARAVYLKFLNINGSDSGEIPG
jgi:DNA polymerase III epsilon subunit-like protein